LIYSSTANAELNRDEIKKDLKAIKSVTMAKDGVAGVWFDLGSADIILQMIEVKLPKALDIIDAQTEQINSLKLAVDQYKLSIDQYKDLATYNKNMLDIALKYFPDLKPPEYSWYEKPVSTFIYGILVGAAIIVTSSYVLDNIKQ